GWPKSKTKSSAPPRRIKCGWCSRTSTAVPPRPWPGDVSKSGAAGALGGTLLPRQSPGFDDQAGATGREPSGRHGGAREVGRDQCVHGRLEQRLQCDQTQSARRPFHHAPHGHALLHRRQAPLAPVLTPLKTAGNPLKEGKCLPPVNLPPSSPARLLPSS